MSESTEPARGTISASLQSPRSLGLLALALWCLAFISSALRADFAHDHIKVLLFTGSLIMINVALALLVTLIWFMTKHYIKPNVEIRAMDDYKYRAGYRDATARYRHLSPDLHLVRPAEPTIPAQQPRGAADRADAGNM